MLQLLLGLLALSLLIFHFIIVPTFFGRPKEPFKKFKKQLISFGIVSVIASVGFAIAEIGSWESDVLVFFVLVSTIISILSIIGFIQLRTEFHNVYTEDAYKKKFARQEETMKMLAERAKEQEEKSRVMEAQSKEFESLKSFLENQKITLKSKEHEFVEKENHLSKKHEDFENLFRNREAELQNKANSLYEKEDQLDQLLNERLVGKEAELSLRFKKAYDEKMSSFMDSVAQKYEQRISSAKQSLVEDVFSFDSKGQDEIFELKKTKEILDKEKAELEKNKFLLEVDERLSKAREHVLEAKNTALEVKSENTDIRSEIKSMTGDFKIELLQEKGQREKTLDGVLHKLELEEERRKSDVRDVGNKIALLGEQTKGQLLELANVVSSNLKDLEMRTMSSFREVRESLSDMKLQFGQEILRLDGQQGQILNELEKYYLKNQEFVQKCQSLALEARSQNIEGQNLFNNVGHLYNQHKIEAKAIESRLQTSLDQVAVKEGHLANSVGETMLKLKSISDEQYIAMKDLALEKKDVNILWKEKNQEHTMNLQEVRHQKQDLDRMKQFFDQEKSHFSDRKLEVMENARLTHQLYMTEHRYTEALKKAQSSQGFLTKIAKAAEYAMSKK